MVNKLVLDFAPPVPLVRALMREYGEQLGVDLCFQNFESELAGLPGSYAAPAGCLVVAFVDDKPAGCGTFRPLAGGFCEMKRLYTREAFRGYGVGRQIAQALLEKAREAGYQAMRLDTLASLLPAVALYRSLGFREIASYNGNPLPDCVFLEAPLRLAASQGEAVLEHPEHSDEASRIRFARRL